MLIAATLLFAVITQNVSATKATKAAKAEDVSEPLKCGVASAVFGTNAATAATAFSTGKLAFWWNWDTEPKFDAALLDGKTAQGLKDSFVPMLWGTSDPPSLDFLADHEGDVMGFNEPGSFLFHL